MLLQCFTLLKWARLQLTTTRGIVRPLCSVLYVAASLLLLYQLDIIFLLSSMFRACRFQGDIHLQYTHSAYMDITQRWFVAACNYVEQNLCGCHHHFTTCSIDLSKTHYLCASTHTLLVLFHETSCTGQFPYVPTHIHSATRHWPSSKAHNSIDNRSQHVYHACIYKACAERKQKRSSVLCRCKHACVRIRRLFFSRKHDGETLQIRWIN